MTLPNSLLVSNIAFFALSALAFAMSMVVFFLSRANDRDKDRQLEHYKAEAGIAISQANGKAEAAKADAERARLLAAEIAERLQKTEQTLNQAQLGRILTVDQRSKLVAGLKGFKTTANLFVSAVAAPESQSFGYQIERAMEDAGLTLYSPAQLGQAIQDGSEKSALEIGYGSAVKEADVKALAGVFATAGLPTTTQKYTAVDERRIPEAANFLTVTVYPRKPAKF